MRYRPAGPEEEEGSRMSTGSRTKAATPAAKKTTTKKAAAAPTGTKAAAPAKKAAATPARKAAPKKSQDGELTSDGTPAFAFSLAADDGSTVKLDDFAGKRVVLYFYPKDDTPGCTRQACAFRDNIDAIRERGAVVLGVSRDSQRAHSNFKSKYNLNFPLLIDADAAVHRAYGAWGTKSNYGRTFEGALRTTVIIDEQGRIAKRFPNVKVDGHADAVLEALDALGG